MDFWEYYYIGSCNANGDCVCDALFTGSNCQGTYIISVFLQRIKVLILTTNRFSSTNKQKNALRITLYIQKGALNIAAVPTTVVIMEAADRTANVYATKHGWELITVQFVLMD